MLKKILLVGSALVMTSGITLAGGPEEPGVIIQTSDPNSTQFYIGALAGFGIGASRYQASNLNDRQRFNTYFHDGSALIGGDLGIQYFFNSSFALGLQANALYNSYNQTDRVSVDALGSPNHITSLDNNFQYGVDARAIVHWSRIYPYALVGVESGSWDLGLRNHSGLSHLGIPANTDLGVNDTLTGPKVGVGVSFLLSQNWRGNFEYSYTWFGDLKRNLTDSLTNVVWRHKVRVHQNSLTAGLSYMFDV